MSSEPWRGKWFSWKSDSETSRAGWSVRVTKQQLQLATRRESKLEVDPSILYYMNHKDTRTYTYIHSTVSSHAQGTYLSIRPKSRLRRWARYDGHGSFSGEGRMSRRIAHPAPDHRLPPTVQILSCTHRHGPGLVRIALTVLPRLCIDLCARTDFRTCHSFLDRTLVDADVISNSGRRPRRRIIMRPCPAQDLQIRRPRGQ